ncbi:hypothetical protein EPUL_006187, partial [Erysiphe pulchra]
MSPELSRAFRNLSTRVVQKRGTKGPKVNSIAVNHEMRNNESSSLNNIISYVNMEERAFCVPAVIRTRKDGKIVDVKLPPSVAQADTGSDMVVISYGLIKYLNLPMKLLSENGFSGLTMNVANGTSSPLKYFTSFQINVLGISRHVEAFLRPWNSSNEQEFHLLLGLPWLHDANAKIYIRDSIIKIGDPNRSEKIVQIQGPEFTQSSHHKLILHPKQPKNRDPRSNCSESSSDDGDDSDYDSDSDISLDENIFEDNKLGQESKKKSAANTQSFYQTNKELKPSNYSQEFRSNINQGPKLLVDRRPLKRTMSNAPQSQIDSWFLKSQIKLGPLKQDQHDKITRLLYTYKDLNSTELAELPPTDLYIHRVRLKDGIKPWNRAKQRRWPQGKEFWLRRIINDGLKCGMYERTMEANGELSDWNAQANLVDKSDNPGEWDEPRLTFNYQNVVEDIPGFFVELSSTTHDYMGHPSHRLFHKLDFKHGYWAISVHPDDRKYFAFSIA